MMLAKWDKLPLNMQNESVRKYYDILKRRRFSLLFKRLFDIAVSLVMLVLFSPFCLILAAAVKLDSPGPVFFRQVRITKYGREFKIHKFRSMVTGADRLGNLTVKGDARVTRVGRFIRKYRLDETGQLLDVLCGNMTFVGTRPEVPKFVNEYSPEMLATLLLPAGITSEASIYYKDEAALLNGAEDSDKVYIEKILPSKMEYNLSELKKAGLGHDIKLMFKTFFAVIKRDKKGKNAKKSKRIEETV